jgi:type I restriction enzyme M protein
MWLETLLKEEVSVSDVVQKLWGFFHTLRHDGIDYGDYIEQITYLLFLKMADERDIDLAKVSMRGSDGKKVTINCSWPRLIEKSGSELTDYYIDVLRALGQQTGILGDIFSGSQSRFTNPVNLKKLLTVIDETEWTTLEVSVKADAFEGLLEKAASEPGGRGQVLDYASTHVGVPRSNPDRWPRPEPSTRSHPSYSCDVG